MNSLDASALHVESLPAATADARSPLSTWLEHLAASNLLSAAAIERVLSVCRETGDRPAAAILKLGFLSDAALAAALAQAHQLPRIESRQFPTCPVSLPRLAVDFLRDREVLPIDSSDRSLTVAVWDPSDVYVSQALRFATGLEPTFVVAARNELATALEKLYIDAEALTAISDRPDADELDRLKDLARDAPVIRLVQRLVSDAVARRASDIHFEPAESHLVVRYRRDGVLQEVERFNRDTAAAVVSRIKVMAGLDIAERRLPQDGRVRMTIEGKEIDFRVATSPVLHGETLVMRILDRHDVALDFQALGFNGPLTEIVRAAVSKPHGIVLVTGPTGSGKTTTLYAALAEINRPTVKILTIEDPVEYTLAGVNQVHVKPQINLTFANALRSFLRQDPDILMVGEIRDKETAEIAVQAALTGHLLLSTLHTNSAAAAITRLLDMGIDDYLLTSTLHLILGQRLIRRLCGRCREPFAPGASLLSKLRLTTTEATPWYRATGCQHCQGSGYYGRTTVIEALLMTERVRSQVLAHADAQTLELTAVAEGMLTMLGHGLARVRAGETSIEEVLRVANAP